MIKDITQSEATEDGITDKQIDALIAKHQTDRNGVIDILEAIQASYGYLPPHALRIVAKKMNRSLVDIYGVATFYQAFSLRPKGKHRIVVCLGTACHVRGAPAIVEEFERQLGIKAGETTPDMKYTLETVNCLGACALGPIVVVDERYYSKVIPTQVRDIINNSHSGDRDTADSHQQQKTIGEAVPS
ncbi:MAG: NADH-quinone oxidoreductase subunit NuoE [Planctomycetes bacterium]|nr:NADH-quinone oxidoreductase subunit NuoE [Planctomycetota bacterium]